MRAAGSGGDKDALVRIAQAHAVSVGRDHYNEDDLNWAMKGIHPGGQPRLDPTENMAYGLAVADTGDPNAKPTREHWQQASKALHGGAGADARGVASLAAHRDKVDKLFSDDAGRLLKENRQSPAHAAEYMRRFYLQRGIDIGVGGTGVPTVPDVRDPD
jgi:hypothetical protein